jgi:hypothetical protein
MSWPFIENALSLVSDGVTCTCIMQHEWAFYIFSEFLSKDAVLGKFSLLSFPNSASS